MGVGNHEPSPQASSSGLSLALQSWGLSEPPRAQSYLCPVGVLGPSRGQGNCPMASKCWVNGFLFWVDMALFCFWSILSEIQVPGEKKLFWGEDPCPGADGCWGLTAEVWSYVEVLKLGLAPHLLLTLEIRAQGSSVQTDCIHFIIICKLKGSSRRDGLTWASLPV